MFEYYIVLHRNGATQDFGSFDFPAPISEGEAVVIEDTEYLIIQVVHEPDSKPILLVT